MHGSARPGDWLKIAKDAAREAVKNWLQLSQVTSLVISGPTGTLKPGGLRSRADFRATMVSKMMLSGAPAQVVTAFSEPLAQAWNAWFDGYQVQLRYPTFAAVPGRAAPPTPCVPQPVKAGASSNAHRLTSVVLEREIKVALGKAGAEAGASESVQQFAKWFADRFSAWQSVAVVANVIGKGPVPTFAPPYVPVGPVVGRDNLGMSSLPPLSDHHAFDL
jgi:hypothetical protein